MIIIAPRFLNIATRGFARAMALYPFIFIHHKSLKEDTVLLNHERIHFKQQLECGVVFFYLLYGLHYIILRLKKMPHHAAYRAICFEKEAYENETNLNYLRTRKCYAWIL